MVSGTVHPEAVSAVKPSTNAMTNLLLRRDMVLPPFRLRTICCQRVDLLPETHVQYDDKELDHEPFLEISGKFFRTLHSIGTIPGGAFANRYVVLKCFVSQRFSNQDHREISWRNGMRAGAAGN